MPNRMLRDWTDSQKFDGISADCERLFVRLIMKSDDFGRYYGDNRLIRAHCYPLLDNLRVNDLDRWLDDLSHRQLILRYETKGRQYLAIVNYGQRLKQSRAKYPPMDGEEDDWLPTGEYFERLPGSSGKFPPEVEEKKKRIEQEHTSAERFEVFWNSYPKKVGKRSALTKWQQLKPDLDKCLAAIEHQRKSEQWRKDGGQFIPHPDTWLHQGRWDDGPKVEKMKHTPATKQDPPSWTQWRDSNYPNAEKIPFDKATRDIQKEFEQDQQMRQMAQV